jgi:Mg2+ and Co2+ transporter CorA
MARKIDYTKKTREELIEIIKDFHVDSTTELYISLNRKLYDISQEIKRKKIKDPFGDGREDVEFIMDIVSQTARMAQGMRMLREGSAEGLESEYNFEDYMERE